MAGYENIKDANAKRTPEELNDPPKMVHRSTDPKTNRPRSGVEIEDIRHALLHGEIRTRKRDPDSIKFVTDKCIVSVNPNTGNLIQCNPQ